MRRFNTAGPCRPEDHYMLPAEARLPRVRKLVEQKGYFLLHAPRQSGKSTSLYSIARALTREGRFTAVVLSVEIAAWVKDDPEKAEGPILASWRGACGWQLPPELQPPPWTPAESGSRLGEALREWSLVSPRPLVVFLDEVDALQDAVIISLLRQLRQGFPGRPHSFPWSLALVGLRDIRDFLVAAGGSGRLHTASPFNIKEESLTLRDFTREEVAELYSQHTAETGQVFPPGAVDRAYYWTRGQPWLTNALARQVTEEIVPDPALPITVECVDQAKEILVQRRDTHLDSLAERLQEPRIRRIIQPMLAGALLPGIPDDDRRFVLDLGLLRKDHDGGLVIANPIYAQIIPRYLAETPGTSMPQVPATWLTPDGHIDMDRLLDAFLDFWRRHGRALMGTTEWHEIAAHLVLMAFLDRVANSGGVVEREYAVGRGRMDLCLRHRGQLLGIEIKVWRDHAPDPMEEGLEQLDGYLEGLGQDRGWLVIFDRRSSPQTSPVATPATSPAGRRVMVVRA